MTTLALPTSEFRISRPRNIAPRSPPSGPSAAPDDRERLGSVTMLPPFVRIRNESRSPRYAPAGSPVHVGGRDHDESLACSWPAICPYRSASHSRLYDSVVIARTVGTGRPLAALTRIDALPSALPNASFMH